MEHEEPVRWRVIYQRCLRAFPPEWESLRVVRPVYADGREGRCTIQRQSRTGEWETPRMGAHSIAVRLAQALEDETTYRRAPRE